MSVSNTQQTPRISDECAEKYAALNTHNPTWRFILMKLNEDESAIVLEHSESVDVKNVDAMNNLRSKLSDQHPMWAMYNFPYVVAGGGKRNKTAMIRWCPDTLTRDSFKESARVKMIAVTCGSAIKKQLKGSDCNIQANSLDEITFDEVLTQVSRHEREEIDSNKTKEL